MSMMKRWCLMIWRGVLKLGRGVERRWWWWLVWDDRGLMITVGWWMRWEDDAGDGKMSLCVEIRGSGVRRELMVDVWGWWWLVNYEGGDVRVAWYGEDEEGLRRMCVRMIGWGGRTRRVLPACRGFLQFYTVMIMVIEGGLGLVNLGFFSISSLDFLFSKTSCFLPTLETLAQLNNYENDIFHNYCFLDRLVAKCVKLKLQRLVFLF